MHASKSELKKEHQISLLRIISQQKIRMHFNFVEHKEFITYKKIAFTKSENDLYLISKTL